MKAKQVSIFLAEPPAAAELGALLDGLSDACGGSVREVFYFLTPERRAAEVAPPPPVRGRAVGGVGIHVLHALQEYPLSAKIKMAFDYAIAKNDDAVIVVHTSLTACGFMAAGCAALTQAFELRKTTAIFAAPQAPAATDRRILQRIERGLGVKLKQFPYPVAMYAVAALRGIPFGNNDDGARFDVELLIQCRAWGGDMSEVFWPPSVRDEPAAATRAPPLRQLSWLTVALQIVRYRLHQLHIWRDPRFFMTFPHRYGLKESPFSSHGVIVSLVKSSAEILDVGCGPGLLANQLKSKGGRVTGIDIMETTPADALVSYQMVDLEKDQVWKLHRVFDTVLLADVLEHVRNPEDVLKNAARLLKSNGRLIASTGNIAIWFYRLSLLLGRFNYGERGILDRGHVHLYTIRNFKRLLQQNGFRILHTYYTNIPFEVLFESTGRSFFIRALDLAYAVCARLWPSMFAYQVVIEAEVRGFDAN